jgi:hypothetical protein
MPYHWNYTFSGLLEHNAEIYGQLVSKIESHKAILHDVHNNLIDTFLAVRDSDAETSEDRESMVASLNASVTRANNDLAEVSQGLDYIKLLVEGMYRDGSDMEEAAKEADAAHIVAQRAENAADEAYEVAHADERKAAEARAAAWNKKQAIELAKLAEKRASSKSGRSTRRSRRYNRSRKQ